MYSHVLKTDEYVQIKLRLYISHEWIVSVGITLLIGRLNLFESTKPYLYFFIDWIG